MPLPSNFPASLPLPEHLRAVGVITDIDEIEAWFRTDLDPNELKVFFEQAMPDAGWPGEPAAPIYGGHWDYSVRPRERSAVLIVVRTEPGPNPGSFTGGHGAYDLDAPWDVYVHLTNLPPVDVSEPSVASESGSFRTGVG